MSDPHRRRGVAPKQAPQLALKTLKYGEAQEHLLRRLGGALVLQWDELSDEMQDLIIDQAATVEDRDEAAHDASDIENFIRGVKVVNITKPAAAAKGAET